MKTTMTIVFAILAATLGLVGQNKVPPSDTKESAETRMKIRVENQQYEARMSELENRKAIAEGRKTAPKPGVAPEPSKADVYFPSWDEGEIKNCETFSGQPNLLICDTARLEWKESFINLAGHNAAAGLSEEESYSAALGYARLHGKQFLAAFSEEPWPGPSPHKGVKLISWDCTKDKTITCKFAGREN